jgi:hypothetical protein
VGKDARMLGLRSWRVTTMNREEWRKLLREAKTVWVVVPMMMMMIISSSTVILFWFYCQATFYLPNVVVVWLTYLVRIWEVLGSNLNPETGNTDWDFCGFFQSLRANAGIVS